MQSSIVERPEVAVMFLRVEDSVPAIQRGWARLESLVALRGRRFYGVFDARAKEYRMCAELRDGDDPSALGLERGVIAGGRYLRARLRGEPPAIYDQIAPTFRSLAASATADETRPEIEFYRSRDEVDCLLPV